jgi:hypothetical protein
MVAASSSGWDGAYCNHGLEKRSAITGAPFCHFRDEVLIDNDYWMR